MSHLRSLLIPALVLTALAEARAQAPVTGLWGVPVSTSAHSPALEYGPIGRFWNPASSGPGRLSGELQVFESPDILGLSGFIGGLDLEVGAARVGFVVGRMEMDDLVRTTTSPIAVSGDIPVFDQHVAVAVSLGTEAFRWGAAFRAHDTRFDADAEDGFTADFGFRLRPHRRVLLAAATHFLPLDLSSQPNTEYYGGLEVELVEAPVWGIPSVLTGRLGTAYRNLIGYRHHFGLGIAFARAFAVDGGYVREGFFNQVEWRPILAVSLHAGRYLVSISRGAGLNGIGATFRLGLEVEAIK